MRLYAKQAFALILGSIAGFLADRVGMPLPWMLGPMIVNTIASVNKAPVHPPVKLRPFVIPIIGVMLGSAISAEIVEHLRDWALTLALMAPFLGIAAAASFLIYRRFGGYDPVTAYYAAMPGGLNEMLLLGTAAGGEERRIALAHASRVLLVVLFVGLFYGFALGVRPGGPAGRPWIALDALAVSDWVFLSGCAIVGVPFGKLLRLPAPNILGPMILSGSAHVLHLVDVAPPTLLVNAAQVVLGTVIGCRFLGSTLRETLRDLGLGLVSSLSMIAVAVTFAVMTSELTGTSVAQVFLAYSPGGLTEMSLLALAMGQDVAFVSVMHILRILLIIIAAPIAFRGLWRR